MMNKNYDIDLIITKEQFEANRQKELMKDTKKRLHLKVWVKATLIIVSCIVAVIIIAKDMQKVSVHTTPVGNYTCKGSVLRTCTGSKEVYNYVASK